MAELTYGFNGKYPRYPGKKGTRVDGCARDWAIDALKFQRELEIASFQGMAEFAQCVNKWAHVHQTRRKAAGYDPYVQDKQWHLMSESFSAIVNHVASRGKIGMSAYQQFHSGAMATLHNDSASDGEKEIWMAHMVTHPDSTVSSTFVGWQASAPGKFRSGNAYSITAWNLGYKDAIPPMEREKLAEKAQKPETVKAKSKPVEVKTVKANVVANTAPEKAPEKPKDTPANNGLDLDALATLIGKVVDAKLEQLIK